MNGMGIGLTVGLGVVIGERIVAPEAGVLEPTAAALFYGGVSGLTFHIWRLALRDWKPPFIGRR